jgi:hypothetical protein
MIDRLLGHTSTGLVARSSQATSASLTWAN